MTQKSEPNGISQSLRSLREIQRFVEITQTQLIESDDLTEEDMIEIANTLVELNAVRTLDCHAEEIDEVTSIVEFLKERLPVLEQKIEEILKILSQQIKSYRTDSKATDKYARMNTRGR